MVRSQGIHYLADEKLIAIIARLCQIGWAERMVLSHDAMVYFDVSELGAIESARLNWNYFHIVENIIPKLLLAGVSPSQIDLMTSRIPKNLWSGQTTTSIIWRCALK